MSYSVPKQLKVLLTVEEVAVAMGLGRTYVYGLVMRNELFSIKLGRKRRIPRTALEEFVVQQVYSQNAGVGNGV